MHILTYICLLFTAGLYEVDGFLIENGIHKVRTRKYGDIVGFIDQVEFNNRMYQVKKFLGIPYAEPPTGQLRFEKPVMKSMLSTPFNAFKFSSKCPQNGLDRSEVSEDCLHLNIFAPDDVKTTVTKKPVMVWIHGGAFLQGYGDMFSGDVIAALADVIVVTINYRVGALGFFSTHDSIIKGNFGLWDQHMAIRWVQENIADFGGDVNNITIFGESAGSSSVIYQTLYPGNKGLFQRAIAESGTIAAWAVAHGHSNYEISLKLAESLGCNNIVNMSVCLKAKTEKDVISMALKFEPINEVNMTWVPVFDGDFVLANTSSILSELSNPLYRPKYSPFFDVDLLIGSTNYDGVVYQDLYMSYINNITPTSKSYNVSKKQFDDIIIPRALEAWLGEKPTKMSKDLAINEYTAWNDTFDEKGILQNTIDILTDSTVIAPTISTADSHLHGNKATYVYQFIATPPKRLIAIASELDGPESACHTDELPFLFGFSDDLKRYWKFTNATVITQNDYRLSRELITMWTNFAKSGNPNIPSRLDTTWPKYDNNNEMYLEIGPHQTRVKQRLRIKQVQFLNTLLPEVQMISKQKL